MDHIRAAIITVNDECRVDHVSRSDAGISLSVRIDEISRLNRLYSLKYLEALLIDNSMESRPVEISLIKISELPRLQYIELVGCIITAIPPALPSTLEYLELDSVQYDGDWADILAAVPLTIDVISLHSADTRKMTLSKKQFCTYPNLTELELQNLHIIVDEQSAELLTKELVLPSVRVSMIDCILLTNDHSRSSTLCSP